MNFPFLLASYQDDMGILTLLGVLAALFPIFVMIAERCKN